MENITMAGFLERHGIAADATPADSNPNMIDDGARMDHWRVKFRFLRTSGDRELSRRRLTVPFSMGQGHHGKAPEAGDVLDCLASDAASIENAQGFEDWARDFGYDTDSRKAHRTYTVCQRQAAKLKRFLGDDAYKTLLWDTERL